MKEKQLLICRINIKQIVNVTNCNPNPKSTQNDIKKLKIYGLPFICCRVWKSFDIYSNARATLNDREDTVSNRECYFRTKLALLSMWNCTAIYIARCWVQVTTQRNYYSDQDNCGSAIMSKNNTSCQTCVLKY